MATLQTTSDVVCLFTEGSLDRPWIPLRGWGREGEGQYTRGWGGSGCPADEGERWAVLSVPEHGRQRGRPDEVVHELARRVPGLELDADVVRVQVGAFKATEAEILKRVNASEGKKGPKEQAEENPAKLVEEMKALPSRAAGAAGGIRGTLFTPLTAPPLSPDDVLRNHAHVG